MGYITPQLLALRRPLEAITNAVEVDVDRKKFVTEDILAENMNYKVFFNLHYLKLIAYQELFLHIIKYKNEIITITPRNFNVKIGKIKLLSVTHET